MLGALSAPQARCSHFRVSSASSSCHMLYCPVSRMLVPCRACSGLCWRRRYGVVSFGYLAYLPVFMCCFIQSRAWLGLRQRCRHGVVPLCVVGTRQLVIVVWPCVMHVVAWLAPQARCSHFSYLPHLPATNNYSALHRAFVSIVGAAGTVWSLFVLWARASWSLSCGAASCTWGPRRRRRHGVVTFRIYRTCLLAATMHCTVRSLALLAPQARCGLFLCCGHVPAGHCRVAVCDARGCLFGAAGPVVPLFAFTAPASYQLV